MLLVAYVGFARSFFLRPVFPEWPSPSEPIFYVHGVFFSAWCVLLVLQAILVGVGRTDVHRKVGVLGVVIALGMVILGVAGALIAANRPTGFNGVPVPPLQFLVVPLFDIAFFSVFVALGVANRTNPQSHKRWMVLATVTLLGAAFTRGWKKGYSESLIDFDKAMTELEQKELAARRASSHTYATYVDRLNRLRDDRDN